MSNNDNNKVPSVDSISNHIHDFIESDFNAWTENTRFVSPIKYELEKKGYESALLPDELTNSPYEIVSRNLLNTVFGGHPANPCKDDAKKRLDSVFSESAYDRTNYSIDQYESLCRELCAEINREPYIALVGPRGCGKTFFTNKWLNDYTKDYLEKECNYVWFRIDVTNIYKIENTHPNHSNNIIEEYFKCHAAYVFLEYSEALKNPSSPPHIGSVLLSKIYTSLIDTLSDANKSEFTSAVDDINTYYQSDTFAYINIDSLSSEKIITPLYLPENEQYFNAYKTVYKYLCKGMNNISCGMIVIIDGVDNISWTRKNEKYRKVCANTKIFLQKIDEVCPVVRKRFILVARPETIPSINIRADTYYTMEDHQTTSVRVKKERSGDEATRDDKVFYVIEMIVPCPIEAVRKKIHAAKISDCFKSSRRLAISGIRDIDANKSKQRYGKDDFKKVLTEFESSENSALIQLVREINKIMSKVDKAENPFYLDGIESSEFIREVFGNNVRAFIHAWRKSKEGKSLQEKANCAGLLTLKRLPEFLLLGGRLFLHSNSYVIDSERYQDIEPGDVFPNIFWYKEQDGLLINERWHGLSGLRVLQLAYHKKGIVAADMIYILHRIFGYSVDILIEHLEAFVAYGLIEILLTKEEQKPKIPEVMTELPELERYNVSIRTSRKGQFHSTLSLYYFHYLYFLSLDTPLHARYLSDESGDKFVRFFVNPLSYSERWFDFRDAIIPTITVFLKHINQYHKKEMTGLRNGTAENKDFQYSVFGPEENALKTFSIPSNWIESLNSNIRMTLKRRRRYTTHPDDWVKLANHISDTFMINRS